MHPCSELEVTVTCASMHKARQSHMNAHRARYDRQSHMHAHITRYDR